MKKEKINFKVKNQNLVGNLFIPKEISFPTPGVVFYHGRGSSQKGYLPRAEALTKQGIICLTFDFRGCGESKGDFDKLSINDGLADSLASFDFLVSQNKVDKDRIGVCGSSFGGYLASIVSSKRKVKSLVLRAPAIYKDSWRDIPYSKIPPQEITSFFAAGGAKENLAFQSIRKFRGSLLVIGSEKDEIVPARVVKGYYQNAVLAKKKKIVFIKKATHKLINERWNQEFIKLIVEWFAKTL